MVASLSPRGDGGILLFILHSPNALRTYYITRAHIHKVVEKQKKIVMSSSLRNAIKRTTHKERSQPAERTKLGLLEKHKDYVLRARDFHKKEDAIKVLKRKAAERNPDEFYFAMEKKKTRDGVHEERTTEQNKYTEDELKLMKTQDLRYVSLKAQTELKRVKKMKETLHCLGAGSEERKHTIFVLSLIHI